MELGFRGSGDLGPAFDALRQGLDELGFDYAPVEAQPANPEAPA